MKPIQFNPSFSFHKSPLGALNMKEEATLRLIISKEYHFDWMNLLVTNDQRDILYRLPMEPCEEQVNQLIYVGRLSLSQEGHYWYYYEVHDVYGTHYLIPDGGFDAILSDALSSYWFLGVYDGASIPPKWPLGKIMYQIMVDRFHKGRDIPCKVGSIVHDHWNETPLADKNIGRDFFGGNLDGIIKKLDYLQSLSVGILYLNPIFEAASNHKYDTGDFLKIDSMFGTENDVHRLIEEASVRGISIIWDGVFNHTGDDSLYFNRYHHYPTIGAYESVDSLYYSWYYFSDYPTVYESWWGFQNLPRVRQDHPSYLKFITGPKGVLSQWTTFGFRGIRLDVVDELQTPFVEHIQNTLKSIDSEQFIIGEVWEEASTKCAYGARRSYFNGHELDSVMNYPLRDAILNLLETSDGTQLRNTMRLLISQYPKRVLDRLMNILGTHDTERLYTMVSLMNKDEALPLLKIATLLQYTLPGIPCMYYGDEIGLEGMKDPFCRGTFRWERVGNQINQWYKDLGKLRNNPIFQEGIYREKFFYNGKIGFSRTWMNETILVLINMSEDALAYSMPRDRGTLIEWFTKEKIGEELVLGQYEFAVIKYNNQ